MSPVSDFVAGGVGPSAFFGDGSDGGVIITGSTTETNNRYWNTLFLDVGGVYVGSNFLVHARISAILNGTYHNDGGAGAAGGGAGAITPAGYLNGNVGAGGAGGAAAGVNAANSSISLGGAGGAGGSGSGGAGGTGGTAPPPSSVEGGIPRTLALLQGMLFGKAGVVTYRSGAGGGGGGGDGTAGAGGGASGGHLWLATPNLIMGAVGIMRAAGGAGGTPAAGNRGGGGGGGGGTVMAITTKAQLEPTAQIIAPGGLPGNGTGTGTAGIVGSDGRRILLQLSQG